MNNKDNKFDKVGKIGMFVFASLFIKVLSYEVPNYMKYEIVCVVLLAIFVCLMLNFSVLEDERKK